MSIPRIPSSTSSHGEASQTAASSPIVSAAVISFCGFCLLEGSNLDLCGRCEDISYCNRVCQKAHWKVHKLVCKPPEPLPIETLSRLDAKASSSLADEYVEPVFDHRTWKLGWSEEPVSHVASSNLFERCWQYKYVLATENVNNWSELVKANFWSIPGATQKDFDIFETRFEKRLEAALREQDPKAMLSRLDKTHGVCMWQWSVKTNKGYEGPSEIIRMVCTTKGVHTLHYAIKKNPMPRDLRILWIEKLKAVEIKKR